MFSIMTPICNLILLTKKKQVSKSLITTKLIRTIYPKLNKNRLVCNPYYPDYRKKG